MRKLLILSVLFVSLLCASAFAALPVLLEATGASQGKIESDYSGTNKQQWMGKDIVIYSMLGHMSAKGNKVITLTKELDKTTPNFYSALLNGEKLTLKLKFYNTGPSGMTENYFSMNLEGVKITSIDPNYPYTFVSANNVYPHLEDITFKFDKAVLVHEASGTGLQSGGETSNKESSNEESSNEERMVEGEQEMPEIEGGIGVQGMTGNPEEPMGPEDEPMHEDPEGEGEPPAEPGMDPEDMHPEDRPPEGMPPEGMPEGMPPEEWEQMQQETME